MATSEHRKLVFFIIDGCSSYYLEDSLSLPGLQSIAKNGVKAKYSKPIFPSLSLPNYYSMFTGLYAEEHGMFSNQMYDKQWKETFHVTEKENRDRWFQQTPEPLWIKTGRLGIRTSMYWPWFVNFNSPYSAGTHLYRSEDVSTFIENEKKAPAQFQEWALSKMTEIVDLLKDPCSQFVVIYWGSLDEICHKYGPRSKEALADLKMADDCLVDLQAKLEKAGLLDNVDILVAADHGQMESPKENHIHADAHVGSLIVSGDIEAWCEGEAYLLIYPAMGKEEAVYEELCKKNIPHVSVVRNEDLPERYRVKKAPRAPPIWIFADHGYSLVDGSNSEGKRSLGVHGYDDSCEFMKGICIGRGPGFKRHPSAMTEEPVTTREYYSIMCRLLGIEEGAGGDMK